MASGRHTDGLLRRLLDAKRTGGVLLPVLALLAIFILSGCGGSDDSGGTTASEGTTNPAEGGGDSGQKQDSASEQDSATKKQGKGGDGQGSGNGGSSNSQQGSNVPQPKGEEERGITPQQKNKATTASITLESPAFKTGTSLPAKYTCDGKNTWPTLRWKGLPAQADELVLLILSVDPVGQKLLFDWAVGGLDPNLTSIEEGKLPKGAVVGENSFGKDGYTICPKKGTGQTYIFMLFAIPEALNPKPGFEARQFREEVLDQSGNVGLLSALYKR